MNTNKAPDKIYVDKFGQSIEGYIPEGCSLVTEYIRKDALLDWLNECKENPVITDLQRGNIQELIEKIESL